MHSEHFTHLSRNSFSGRAPGGRISFGWGLAREGDIRMRGTATRPAPRDHTKLRLLRSTLPSFFWGLAKTKDRALVGQTSTQFQQ